VKSVSRILLIDDSPEYEIVVRKALTRPGLDVDVVPNAREALMSLLQNPLPQLILLDITLPDRDGLQLYADLQADERLSSIPVIFLTGREELPNKLTAFSLGAEDYLVKPVQPLELRARVEARLRKIEFQAEQETLILRGPIRLRLDAQRAEVQQDGQFRELKLTPREFKLLLHLARNEDRVLTRDQILDAVWGTGSEVMDRTVDAHVSALRKKLGPASNCIESVPGTGYRFSVKTGGRSTGDPSGQEGAA
jgi:two-component system phosphate regulon response regulator PhoB